MKSRLDQRTVKMDLKPFNIGNTTCGICNKMYSTKEKAAGSHAYWRSYIPLILHCAHSACEHCIESALRDRGKICCPECKEESIPSQPIQNIILENQVRIEFPANLYILGELMSPSSSRSGNSVLSSNLLTQVPTSTVKKQEQCNECSHEVASLKCQQCADKFCDSCFKAIHSSSKALSRHKAVSLASPSPLCSDEDLLMKQTLPVTESKCLTHPSQYLVMHCNECQLALCTSCFFKDHKEHSVLSLEEKNAAIVEELKIAMENAQPVLQRLKFNYQKLKSGAHSVHAPNASSMKELQQVERTIRSSMSTLHASLQLKEKQLIHALACFSSGTRKLTSDMMAEIQANIKSLDTLVENASTVIASPHVYSMEFDKLLDRLKAVPDHTPCHIVTSQVDVNAAKPKFKMDLASIKAALAQIQLDIPQDASPLSLLSTAELPEDYSIPPIAPAVMQTSDPKVGPSSRPHSVMSGRSGELNSLVEGHSSISEFSCAASGRVNDLGRISDLGRVSDLGDARPPPPCPPASAVVPCMPEEVVVVHVESPGDFYVQRKTAQPHLEKIDHLIQPHYVQKQKPPNRVHLKDIYLAQFEKKWYRARVTQLPPPSAGPDAPLTIFYVDWGNTASLPRSQLRPCSPQLKTIPPLALHCCIHECLPAPSRDAAWAPETVKFFVSLVLKDVDLSAVSMQVYSVVPQSHHLCVDLFILEDYGTTSVRLSLLAHNYAVEPARALPSLPSRASSLDSLPGPLPSTDAVSVTPEEELPRNVQVDIAVSHVESPDYFCVHKASNLSAIDRLASEMQLHYEETHSYDSAMASPDIVMGRIVACKLNSKWYRGFIVEKIIEEVSLELDPNVLVEEVRQVRVYCIDYGYKELLPVENILKLHSKFFKMAAQALKCSLFGIGPATHSAPSESGDSASTREKRHAGWPSNIIEVLNELFSAEEGATLSAARQDSVKGGIQRVILYRRSGAKEECINKKLVDLKVAKAISPRISAARHKNLEKKTHSSASAPKKTMLTYQEKMKKHKLVKKQTTGSRHLSSSESSSHEVTDLDSDSDPAPSQVDALRATYKEVVISHVEDPHRVYVTLASRQKRLQDLSDSIQTHYKAMTQKTGEVQEWKVNDKCIAYYESKAMYGRAVIKSLDEEEDEAEVHFIDVGTRDSVPLSLLYPIQAEFTEEMDGALCCQLSGIVCADGTEAWPDFVKTKLRELLEANRGLIYIYKSGNLKDQILPVHLWVKKTKIAGPFSPSVTTWVCVNKLLVSEACAHATEPYEFIGKHFESPFTSDTLGNSDAALIISTQMKSSLKAPLPACGPAASLNLAFPVALHSAEVKQWLPPEPLTSLELVIKPTNVDYHCRLYFIDPENADLQDQIQAVLSSKYKNSSVRDSDFYWTEGQVCTVKYHLDNGWYRGKIVELEDEERKYGVFFIDYGNTESCVPSELRKEACYHEVPALAVSAMLDGLEPIDKPGDENKEGWPTSTLDIIHSLTVDKQLNVTLLPPVLDGGPYRIQELINVNTREDIIKTLVDSGLVKRAGVKKKTQKAETQPLVKKINTPVIPVQTEKPDTQPLVKKSNNPLIPVQTYKADIQPLVKKSNNALIPVHTHKFDIQPMVMQSNNPVIPVQELPKEMEQLKLQPEVVEEKDMEQPIFSFPPSAISPREGTVLKVHVEYIVSLRPWVTVSVTLTESIDEEVRQVMAEFTELHASIQCEASKQPVLSAPVPDMACVVLLLDEETEEELWRRAIVLPEPSGADTVPGLGVDTVPVLCVDTGVLEQVSRDCLRAVKEEWTRVPAQAVTCVLHGVEVGGEAEDGEVMQELLDTLSEREEDYAFMRVQKCSHNGSLTVELFEDPETTVFLYQPLIDSGSFLMEDDTS